MFETLFSSPLFYVVLILLVLSIFYRREIGRLIERTTRIKGELSKDGIGGELEANTSIDQLQSSSTSSAENSKPIDNPDGRIVMEGMSLEDSQIEDIKGEEVTVRDVTMSNSTIKNIGKG